MSSYVLINLVKEYGITKMIEEYKREMEIVYNWNNKINLQTLIETLDLTNDNITNNDFEKIKYFRKKHKCITKIPNNIRRKINRHYNNNIQNYNLIKSCIFCPFIKPNYKTFVVIFKITMINNEFEIIELS